MTVICKTPSREARLQLAAISASTGATITDGLTWQLLKGHTLIEKSKRASPLFVVPGGTYTISVSHKRRSTTVENILLPTHSEQNCLVYIGNKELIEGVGYHINNEKDYNPETEHIRREADRKSQRAYAQHADFLKKPPTREQLQQQQNLLGKSHMGPLAHPILSHMAQFDGAVEPEVNPVPSENPDTVNELVEQYQLEMQPEFNPKPSTGPGTF